MTIDSKKYDLPIDEFQRFIVGLLTAARIDADTLITYWAESFPGHPDILVEDMPSYLRLNGRVVAALTIMLNAFYAEPLTKHYMEGLLDALRDGKLFRF